MIQEIALDVQGLSKQYTRGPEIGWTLQQLVGDALLAPYRLLRREKRPQRAQSESFWALKDVSFQIARGERVAIIGRNGAGKSTLLKILSRVVYPTEGEARIRGRVTSLLEVGTGFDPSMTGRQNVYANAAIHGLTRKEINERYDAIVEFAQIGPFIDTPIKRYSTGMRARLAFAVAAHLDADILIMDEVLAVGDLSFQRKCLQRVEGMSGGDTTLLFVSHSMDAVSRFCTRGIWLEGGRVVADGPVRDVAAKYVEGVMGIQSDYTHPQDDATPEQLDGTASEESVTVNGSVSDDGMAVAAGSRSAVATLPRLTSAEVDARLLSARIISRQGLGISIAPLDEEVGIEMTYEVRGGSALIVPSICLNSPDGSLVFWAVPAENDPAKLTVGPGRRRATTWLPANFLNTGAYSIGISLVGPEESPMRRYVQVGEALSFVAVEAQYGGARGMLPRDFPGAIRPMLEWETRPV